MLFWRVSETLKQSSDHQDGKTVLEVLFHTKKSFLKNENSSLESNKFKSVGKLHCAPSKHRPTSCYLPLMLCLYRHVLYLQCPSHVWVRNLEECSWNMCVGCHDNSRRASEIVIVFLFVFFIWYSCLCVIYLCTLWKEVSGWDGCHIDSILPVSSFHGAPWLWEE